MLKPDELNVLIVDDEEQVRAMLKRLLGRAGHETWEAGNCSEAEEAMETHDFAVALVDVNLPGSSGLDLTKQIVASHPNTAVIMVTGIDDPVVAASALESGAYGYLVKPFKSSQFAITRTNALIRRRLEMDNRAHLANVETRVIERTQQLQKAYDRLEIAQSAREEFLALASHELRTPLTPILGWARLICSQPSMTHDQLIEAASCIFNSAQHLTSIVDSILSMVDIGSDERVNLHAPMDIQILMDEVLGRFEFEDRLIELSLDLAGKVAFGDSYELSTVLRLLVENALKFTPAGSPLTLRARFVEDDLRIEVQDAGLGIPNKDKDRIFEYFSQGDSSSTRESGGLGVGLYLARRMVQRWQGDIWVEDSAGGGATFVVLVPQSIDTRKPVAA